MGLISNLARGSAVRSLRKKLEGHPWVRPLHSQYVSWRARNGGHPDWKTLLGDGLRTDREHYRPGTDIGHNVLIATSIGGHLPSATVEGMLGASLKLRGAGVDFLLCDAVLPACMTCEVRWYRDLKRFQKEGPSKDHCPHCFEPAHEALSALEANIYRYSEFLDDATRSKAREISQTLSWEDIEVYVDGGVAVGEHAMAGTLRFFARGQLEESSEVEGVLRRYLEASLLTFYALKALFKKQAYDCVLLHHGIYAPQGIIAEVARASGIRVVTWHPAYRKGCFIFSHDGTYHKTLMEEPVDCWEDMLWDDDCETRIMDYLQSRWTGKRDWQSFQNANVFQVEEIQSLTGVDFKKPCIGLLTNVFWDAQLHYSANAFPDMLQWLVGTVRYFEKRPDLQLLIRIHPAEISGTVPSQQKMHGELLEAFPVWPKNVFVIPPESSISTYAAMESCDSVLIFGTKTGVELTSKGIPVIVAGEAWIRGKGVTIDAGSEDGYYQLLDRLPLQKRMDEDQIQRARKYAYHFFFRRMIPLDFMQPKAGWPPYKVAVDGVCDLETGASRGLDIICNGILEGTPFIYPEEETAQCKIQ